ncbi:MAG: L,D-transpeptidase family protein [Persicimonas sp.]
MLTLLVGGLFACGEPTISEEDAEEYVDEWASNVQTTLRTMAVEPAGKEAFHDRFDRAVKEREEPTDASKMPPEFLADRVYRDHDYEFHFVDRGGLTERGEAVWDALGDVEDHGLEADDYALDQIKAEIEQLEEDETRFDELGNYEANESERQAAREWLTSQPESEFELDEDGYQVLTDEVIATDDGDRMEERLGEYEAVSEEIAEHQARLEYLLATDFLRFARNMKHFRLRDIFIHERHDDRWTDPEIEGRRPDKAKGPYRAGQVWRKAAQVAEEASDEDEILQERLAGALEEVLTGETEEAIAELEPDHPQYEGLKDEYARYRKIVDDGGWEKVPVTNGLGPGSTHANVEALKKRLQIEGYYPEDADIDRTFDAELTEAVEAYQKTHQMHVTGRPNAGFWSSLNVPAERRLRQIELNLQRWRESNVRHSDPTYVFINIPDFHVEVWNDQQLAKRIRIVAGNNDKADDDDEEQEADGEPAIDTDRIENPDYPNRTPTLSAYIDRVIYNPFWNVTDRIREEDIDPEARAWVEEQHKETIIELLEQEYDEKRAEAEKEADDEETSLTDSVVGSVGDDEPSGGDAASGERRDETSEDEQTGGDEADREATDPEAGADDEDADEDAQETSSDRKERDREGDEDDRGGVDDDAEEDADADEEDTAEMSQEDERERLEEAAEAYWSKNDDDEIAFDVEAIVELLDVESDEVEEALEERFPYLDPEKGEVDTSETDPDRIPAWYEENEYEVMFPGTEWEYVRMKQGDENALGKVKIIFPNQYDVYLHDTPKKELFNRDIRGFSHGCMRVHKPLDLAEYLLELDGQKEEHNIQYLLAEGEYAPIFLDEQIPVHIDYMTVRVDEEGRANFLADIYDYDEEALDEEG